MIIKLIDANEAIKKAECYGWDTTAINNAPIVDAEPVTRCKDCKFRNGDGYCTKFQWNCLGIKTKIFMTNDNDFCSYAEKKEK